MNLWSDFLTNEQRVIHKCVHYFPVYERHFGRFRNLSVTMLEIGCGKGGSLEMWRRFLGPFASIVGIDIRPECKAFEGGTIAVRIGDQGNSSFLAAVNEEFGPFDIVLDDGSHQSKDMVSTFKQLYTKLQRSGVYMVEDMQTCYWPNFGGGYKAPGSFMEFCKDLLDELNADHTRGAVPSTEFHQTTTSIHFYDGAAVFEKGRHTRNFHMQFGGASAIQKQRTQREKRTIVRQEAQQLASDQGREWKDLTLEEQRAYIGQVLASRGKGPG